MYVDASPEVTAGDTATAVDILREPLLGVTEVVADPVSTKYGEPLKTL